MFSHAKKNVFLIKWQKNFLPLIFFFFLAEEFFFALRKKFGAKKILRQEKK